MIDYRALCAELFEAYCDPASAAPDLKARVHDALRLGSLRAGESITIDHDPRREHYIPLNWYVVVSPDLDNPRASEVTGPVQGYQVYNLLETLLSGTMIAPAEIEVYLLTEPERWDAIDCTIVIDHEGDAGEVMTICADFTEASAMLDLSDPAYEVHEHVDARCVGCYNVDRR
ncbi:hypothetical protein HOU02_gp045 [Caulobacter phage CcrBL9]|uniref:Uncharacterized protein n=1 Tax=Caulobacter phage CcrBL9 TaxID=2283270 RepID=A0A385EED5_9CAUD|nr:hypothetical protein HOU02_gp045 [Caulobacter phage CcrBL9]AXQ69069.1 hypothetical protein CcrBL9_gp045c [Caulobacter phage CcrBL9]